MKITKILAIILQTESYNSLGKKKKRVSYPDLYTLFFVLLGKHK